MLHRFALLLAALLAPACTSSGSLAPSEFHLFAGQGSSEGQIHRGHSPTPAVETEGEQWWIAAGLTWHLGARPPSRETRAWRVRTLELLADIARPAPRRLEPWAAPRAPEIPTPPPEAPPAPEPAPEHTEPHEHPPAAGGLGGGPGDDPPPPPSSGGETALIGAGLTAAAAYALLKRQAIVTASIGAATFLRAGLTGILRRGPPPDETGHGDRPPDGEP